MLLPIEMDWAGFEAEFNYIESKFACALTLTLPSLLIPQALDPTTIQLLKLLPPDRYLLQDPGQAKNHNENKRGSRHLEAV